eukprot:6461438-Amphidinium_carterae.1
MYQRDEIFAQQLQEAQAAEPESVGLLRAELVSSQVNLAQMGTDRLRMTQRSNRLEQLEASAVEVEVLVARERDALHNELMAYLQNAPLQGVAQTPIPQQAPVVPQQPPVVPQQPSVVPQQVPLVPQHCASSPAASQSPQATQVPQTLPQAAGYPTQPQTPGLIQPSGISAGNPNYGMAGNLLNAARPSSPNMVPPGPSINPMSGMGYGYDPPVTPMMTPGMASQGTPSHHYSISTPPHPQHQYGTGGMHQCAGPHPLSVDPLQEVDPWGNSLGSQYPGGMQGAASTIGSVGPPGLGLSHVSGVTGLSTPGIGCFGATATPDAGIGAGPSPGTHPFIPPGTPAPSMAGGTHGGHGGPHDDSSKFKATHAKLPKLDIRSISDSSKIMLAVETWLWLCSTALNTWGAQAVTIWQNAATYARAQHTKWCSYTPAQRIMFASSSYRTFSMAPPVGIVEAHIKSELFNSRILPDEFVQYLVGAKRGGTLAEILELLLQRYLPSEP